ncbi:MAG: nucleotidyltransferase family protein [Desulfofustis sp.]|nr:nucleotidyltransferase family protein [Desulfofustis sp.]
MVNTILALCSRDQGHTVMYRLLRQALAEFHDSGSIWDDLIRQAEQQGLSPLLHKHLSALDFDVPVAARRLLQSLYLRSRRANQIRNETFSEILAAYRTDNIDLLAVKGIALSNFVYSDPALRPMRDIDLLVSRADLARAQNILEELGFCEDRHHPLPDDFYHLTPMQKSVNGLPVSVELHHNLLPFHAHYPRWPFARSADRSFALRIGRQETRTLCLEDTLWYLCLHGFRAPLTYEPYRLIHVADMVSLVESFSRDIDWREVRRLDATLLHVLSRFHYLTPWPEDIVELLQLPIARPSRCIGEPYKGWPQRSIKDISPSELFRFFRETLWPGQWWLQIYYGHLAGAPYLRARWFEHPRTVWRWLKTYVAEKLQSPGSDQ